MADNISNNDFLTLDKAAVYLSNALNENISLIDLYQFILRREFKVSIFLLNEICVEEWGYIDDLTLNRDNPDKVQLIEKNNKIVSYGNKRIIKGLLDFAMIGMETLEVEKLYQKEFIGSDNYFMLNSDIKGLFFVKDGHLLQIRKVKGLKFSNKKIKLVRYEFKRIFLRAVGGFILSILDNLFAKHESAKRYKRFDNEKENRYLLNVFKSEPSLNYRMKDYDNLDELNYKIVIKKSELLQFSQIEHNKKIISQVDLPIGRFTSKERNTLLTLISVLFKKLDIEALDRGIAPSIRVMIENEGKAMSDNTIRKILKQVSDI